MSRVWAGRVTLALLIGAFIVGITGMIVQTGRTDYHLIVESVAVLAGITGVYAERRAAAAERRQAAVRAVQKELDNNIELLERDVRFTPQDRVKPEPRLYPRVDVTAVEACLAQGALMDDEDAPRAQALDRWREQAETFNRGLNLTELLFYGLHLAAPDAGQVMVRVDDELQARRSEMATETRSTRDLLRSAP